jgi:hypothetical protein
MPKSRRGYRRPQGAIRGVDVVPINDEESPLARLLQVEAP